MASMQHTLVMDIAPWPRGRGFTGAKAWWDYVLSKDERRRLDSLMGLALLDEDICRRLVKQRETALLDSFGLSKETQTWLKGIRANSLTELAEAIVAGQPGK